jgi:CO/xanthine dehydrogenase FAD-binding subunit
MKTFTNANARDLRHATALSSDARKSGLAASFAGGGSDLLALVKERIVRPDD